MSREKKKGYRGEIKIVDLHKDAGIECTRVPFSGAAGYLHEDLQHDIIIGKEFKGEVKSRASDAGFKRIKDWMGEADMLFIIEDRKDPLVVLPWYIYERIIDEYFKEV